ncbi:Glutamate 5-kinase, partial [Dissostichus eleginoides]
MDKGALLMLLCLQAFLLITTLPSSEAAALLREDLTPPDRRAPTILTLDCWLLWANTHVMEGTFTSSDAAPVVTEHPPPPPSPAFLLITTLPSSEAAALLREDLTAPDRRVPTSYPRLLAALGKHT